MSERTVVELNYGRMMQRAMQGLVAEALGLVAEHGLPGDHHFYISFQTTHPGVDMPDWLREKFADEMMIVLQYEFEDLAVAEDRFSVRLSFDEKPARLVVPFAAVLQFADPSAEFGLRFDPSDPSAPEDGDDPDGAQSSTDAAESETEDKPAGEVVSLDAFRKK